MRWRALVILWAVGACSDERPELPSDLEWQLRRVAGELNELGLDVDLEGISIEYRRPGQAAETSPDAYRFRPREEDWAFFGKTVLGDDPRARHRTPAGRYAPWRQAIVIRNSGMALLAGGDEVVAHEAVHVYQHRRRGLFTPEWYRKLSTLEKFTILQCLFEGEAEVWTLAFRLGRTQKALRDIHGEALDRGARQGVPSTASLAYPVGRRFVFEHVTRDGWDALDDLYAHPPPSTEQLLHPEKRGQDEPTAIRWPDPAPDGAKVVFEDTLGELQILMWLGRRHVAYPAATGWDGDSVRVYEVPGRGRVAIWMTLWDRAEDAGQFVRAVRDTGFPARVFRKDRVVLCCGSDVWELREDWPRTLLDRVKIPPVVPADAESTRLAEERWRREFRSSTMSGGSLELPMLGARVPAPVGFNWIVVEGAYALWHYREDGMHEFVRIYFHPAGRISVDDVKRRLDALQTESPHERVLSTKRVSLGGRAALLAEHAIRWGTTWFPARQLVLYIPRSDGVLVVGASVWHAHREKMWPRVRAALLGVRVRD